MHEIDRILQLWTEAESRGESAVLVTVVKTRGSSYRLPGARLLLVSTGQRAGSVSGGCLEDDLVKKAWWLTEGGPIVRRYDTTPEDDIAPAYGLGCSGIIHVLLERLRSGEGGILPLLRDVRSQRRPALVAHLVEPPNAVGRRLMIDTAGRVSHNIANEDLVELIEAEARSALASHSSRVVHLRDGAEAFLETLAPAVRLLIFGAGDDAVPLTNLAKLLGWDVFVLDGRAHYARREKFPRADKIVVRSAGQEELIPAVDPWTVAVLMTHSYSQDLDILRELSSRPLRYLGILGPRKRTARLLSDAAFDAATFSPALHSPVGLDIGADGPEQVALAVVAEIQATLNGREGGMLRDRAGSIHAQEEGSDDPQSLWLKSIVCA